jgi:hypothetical protein
LACGRGGGGCDKSCCWFEEDLQWQIKNKIIAKHKQKANKKQKTKNKKQKTKNKKTRTHGIHKTLVGNLWDVSGICHTYSRYQSQCPDRRGFWERVGVKSIF